jgi:type I restriction enzyme, S subunit
MALKKKPALRFKGFTDDWEQRKVVEVAPLQRGFDLPASQMKDGPYPVIMSNGVGGWHSQYKAKGPGVVTGRSGTIGKLHYIEDNYWPHNTTLWVTNFHGNNEKFIYYLYQKLDLTRFQSGSGVPTLNRNDVHDSIVSIPLLKEQRQIADCLSGLDNLITLHQRKYAMLKKIKKSFLEKMFPKNGKRVPELRFSGFTDDWEQRKLGDLGKARSGIGFPNDEQGGKDGIPFYKVSDMNNAGNEHEMITANNYVTREQIARKGWSVIEEVPAIFFAKVGAAVLLNRKRLCRFPFLLDNNTMAYSIDRSVLNTDFAKTLFETIDLTALIQVGALPSYNAGDVENVNVVIPRMAEQKKIGANFKKLDNLITLHQRKLEKLQNLKKALLKKMFI